MIDSERTLGMKPTMDWKKILKLADQMGIKYTTNSATPGFFTTENGIKKNITVEELFKEWKPLE
jgi:hypothetical protein